MLTLKVSSSEETDVGVGRWCNWRRAATLCHRDPGGSDLRARCVVGMGMPTYRLVTRGGMGSGLELMHLNDTLQGGTPEGGRSSGGWVQVMRGIEGRP